MFRVGTIGSKDIDWGDVFTICDLKVVALETTAADPSKVYGVAQKPERQEVPRATALPDRPGDARRRHAARPRRRAVQRRRPLPPRANGEGLGDRGGRRPGAEALHPVRRFPTSPRRAALTPTASAVRSVKGRDDIAVFRTRGRRAGDTLYAVAETSQGPKVLLGYQRHDRIARIPLGADGAARLESTRRPGCSSSRRRTGTPCARGHQGARRRR